MKKTIKECGGTVAVKMTIRDSFAMAALQAIVSNNTDLNYLYDPVQQSRTAFIYADAMLKARGEIGN